LVSKLKLSLLGAYRIAVAPFARRFDRTGFNAALEALAGRDIPIMLFVGNKGCIEIHSGPIHTLQPMGPWQNIMDPGFNLHLRADQVAEVWAVEKPTKRGATPSIEAFDKDGMLIAQIFAYRKEDGPDSRAALTEIIDGLPFAMEAVQ